MDGSTTEALRTDVRRLLLHMSLAAPQRKAAKRELREKYGIGQVALDRHIAAVRSGQLHRQIRSDSGRSRKIAPEQQDMLAEIAANIVNADGKQVQTDTQVYGVFRGLYPDTDVSYDTVHRVLAREKKNLRALRVVTPQQVQWALPNDRWEADASLSDCFFFDKRLGDIPKRAQLLAVIDNCSRMVLWASYVAHADSATFGGVMMNAVLPKDDHLHWPAHGLPVELAVDNGLVFKGSHGRVMLSEVGIALPELPGYRPEAKGRIERLFRTIHDGFENTLPGWCPGDNTGEDNVDPTRVFKCDRVRWIDRRPSLHGDTPRPLLNLDEANEALRRWIVHVYHVTKHSAIGCAPRDLWASRIMDVPERLQHPPRELLEASFLLLRETRVVRRGQVQVENLFFHDDLLASYEGCRVQVRYSPDQAEWVAIYHNDRRLCEARNVAPIIAKPLQDGFRKNAEMVRAQRRRKQELAALPGRVGPGEARELMAGLQHVTESASILTPVGETVHPKLLGLCDKDIKLKVVGLCGTTTNGVSLQSYSGYERNDIPEHLRAWYDTAFLPNGEYRGPGCDIWCGHVDPETAAPTSSDRAGDAHLLQSAAGGSQ